MRTIVLIQNINHSFIVVSRKYTNLNWQNNTFFSTKPCFLKKNCLRRFGRHFNPSSENMNLQKDLCNFASFRKDGMIELTYTNFVSFFFPRETRNKSLVRLMQISEMQNNVTNIAANSYPSVSTQSTRCYFLDKHK